MYSALFYLLPGFKSQFVYKTIYTSSTCLESPHKLINCLCTLSFVIVLCNEQIIRNFVCYRSEENDARQPLMLSDSESTEVERNVNVNLEMDDIEVHKQPHPKNINVRAAFIHVIGDILQSIGVLIAAVIIKFKVNREELFIEIPK